MNTFSFLSVDHPCDETLQWAKKRLSQADLRPMQTFDLQTARVGLHDCSCPNHGTEACDCQMVVLLVYGDYAEPITLTLHGNNEQTWLSISDDPAIRSNATLVREIHKALDPRV